MGSSINMNCIARNFFFILTGMGKGLFNVFIGTLLFLNDPEEINASTFLGCAFLISGCIFMFLSKFKNMTDSDLQRATSLYGKELQAKAVKGGAKVAYNNKDTIARAAVNNK